MAKVASNKDEILKVAAELFAAQGFRATTMDTVITKAKIAKGTLYHHYPTKDRLILACLEQEKIGYFGALDKASAAGLPVSKLLEALLDHMLRQIRGIAHFNALAEYPDGRSSIHKASLGFSTELSSKLSSMLKQVSVNEPPKQAERILLFLSWAHTSQLHQTSPSTIKLQAIYWFVKLLETKNVSANNHEERAKLAMHMWIDRAEVIPHCGACGYKLSNNRCPGGNPVGPEGTIKYPNCVCKCGAGAKCLVHLTCSCPHGQLCSFHKKKPDVIKNFGLSFK